VIFALLHALLLRVQAKNTRPVDVLLEDSFSAVALMKGVIACVCLCLSRFLGH